MKRKSLFLFGTVLSSLALIGGTLAAALTPWAVTDTAEEKTVTITPGAGSQEEATKSVVLDWGDVELVNVQNLAKGGKKGPYKVEVKATTSTTEAYEGAFTVKLVSTTTSGNKLIDHLQVKLFDTASDAGDAVITLNGSAAVVADGKATASVSEDIEVTNATAKPLYLYVYLDNAMTDEVYANELCLQTVDLKVDWGYGSTTSPVTSRTIYFNKTNSWGDVYLYAWKTSDGSKNNGYPGIKMTQAKGNIYSVSLDLTDGYDRVIFNNGSEGETNQVPAINLDADKPYYNGGSWQAKPNLDAETVYYLVGEHNEWTTSSAALMTKGTYEKNEKPYTYKIENVSIGAGKAVKVVSSLNDWYGEWGTSSPDIIIGEPNNYDFYFNPEPGSGNPFVYCEAHSA